MNDDPMTEKLRRLIRLSESANRHEGRLAMLRAIELARKHGIDLQRVFQEESSLGSDVFQPEDALDEDSEYFQRYAAMLTHDMNTSRRLAETIADLLNDSTTQPELCDSTEWKANMRALATAMLKLPDTILSPQPPQSLTTLHALYSQWSVPYTQRARCLLQGLSSLDAGDTAAYIAALKEFATLSQVVSSLASATATYIEQTFCNQRA